MMCGSASVGSRNGNNGGRVRVAMGGGRQIDVIAKSRGGEGEGSGYLRPLGDVER
jgi:hypothetical protein